MKISVKQGRLMAVMAAMILIIGIFVVGKMLGYGSANKRYLLEGYDDDVVEATGDCAGEMDCDGFKNKKEGMKNKKETYETQKPLQPKECEVKPKAKKMKKLKKAKKS